MAQLMTISGMVLSSMPMGEYDRRLVILTPDRGKISAFARGARRPGNALMAAAQPFVYADFSGFEGRSSYTLTGARVVEYFDSLRDDIDLVLYGSYFLELAAYFARENEDCRQMLALLFLAVRALVKRKVPLALIREVYELRMLTINGEYPDFFACRKCGKRDGLAVFSLPLRGMLCGEHADRGSGSRETVMNPAAVYAAQMAVTAPLAQIFAFSVTEEAIGQIRQVLDGFMREVIDRSFPSLEMLEGF